MKKFTKIILMSLFLSSCAGVSPTSLQPVSQTQTKILEDDLSYQQYYSLAGNLFIYTLAAGDYAAKYEDRMGVYFEGQGKCFKILFVSDDNKKKGLPPPPPHGYACGIYMPRDATKDAKIYFYRDPEVSKEIFSNASIQVVDAKGVAQPGGGIGLGIVSAIDSAELKNLHFHQDQPLAGTLRAKLR